MKKLSTKSIFIVLFAMFCAWNLNAQTHNIILLSNPVYGGTTFGDGIYESFTMVTVTATPDTPYYEFRGWMEDGEWASVNSEYCFTVTKDRTLIAIFKPATLFEVTVSANPAEGGTVSGGGYYTYGDLISISAEAKPGYQFLNWTKYMYSAPIEVFTGTHHTFQVTDVCAYVAFFQEIGTDEIINNVDSFDTETISIYPNPTTGELTIRSSESGINSIEVFDVNGKKLSQISNLKPQISTQIDISDFPAGIYFLQLQTEQGTVTKKFVKN